MTRNDFSNRTKTIIIASMLAIVIGIAAITPAYANNLGYIWSSWFVHNGDPEICFLDSELDLLTVVNGNTTDIRNEVEQTRLLFNTEIDGLTIGAEQPFCNYNRIEVGAKDLGILLGGYARVSQYYVSPWEYDLAETEIDFNTIKTYEIGNEQCSIFGNLDPFWIVNHEMGHALTLAHHDDFFIHSLMEPSCSIDMDTIYAVDKTSLELRYN